MRSRYKKFKEAEFFNELTGFIVEVLDTKNSKRQNFSLELTGFIVEVLDTKNSKRQNFFTRTDTVASSLFFLK